MIVFTSLFPLVADSFDDMLKQVDILNIEEKHDEVKTLLEQWQNRVYDTKSKAEVYWRLSRALCGIGYLLKRECGDTDKILKTFEQGEKYADKAIENDSNNPESYYWKASNIGLWGQTKGILDSLFKAGPMKDLLQKTLQKDSEHGDSYYVLGQMYEQVPGWPIAFGNVDYAVSLGRKSIPAHEKEVRLGIKPSFNYDFYTELANHLWARNWNADQRKREQKNKQKEYNKKRDPLEKNCFYEGIANIPYMSDRDEARMLINKAIQGLLAIPNRNKNQELDLEKARDLKNTWK